MHAASLADGWTQAAVAFTNVRNNNPGDLSFLYHVLKNNINFEQEEYSFGKEFHCRLVQNILILDRP